MRPATVPDCLLERASRSPTATAFWRRTDSGWTSETWQTVLDRIRCLSGHLTRLGLVPGDRVAIVMPTSIEWELCHLACLATGCIVIGVDTHDAHDNIRHILRTAPPKALIVATAEQWQTLSDLLTEPVSITIINGPTAGSTCHSLPALLAQRCATAGS